MINNTITPSEPPSNRPRPLVLLLLDGWGVSQTRDNNAIRLAKVPNFKDLVNHYPAAIISGSPKKDSLNYTLIGSGQLKPKKKITLGKILANHNFKQLRIAETEKFALLTNFFDLSDESLNNEDRILVASGEKASQEVVAKLIKTIKSDKYDFILSSLADIDQVSHAGDFVATVKAIATVDKLIKKIVKAVLAKNGLLIISSAHGYAEEVFDIQTEAINRENSDNPVPFLIVGEQFAGKTIGLDEAPANDLSLLEPIGSLIDIAPTILKILNIETPPEMTGKSLL